MARNRLNPWPAVADLFAALMVGGIAALSVTAATLDMERQRLVASEQKNQTLTEQLSIERKKRKPAAEKGLRSDQMPMCDEPQLKQQLKPILFTATVVGQDEFIVEDKRYGLKELLESYESQRKQAAENGCMYHVELKPDPNLRASDYMNAERHLRNYRLIPVPPKQLPR